MLQIYQECPKVWTNQSNFENNNGEEENNEVSFQQGIEEKICFKCNAPYYKTCPYNNLKNIREKNNLNIGPHKVGKIIYAGWWIQKQWWQRIRLCFLSNHECVTTHNELKEIHQQNSEGLMCE